MNENFLSATNWPAKMAFLATTMMAIGGCMSSPGEQLASVQTLSPPNKAHLAAQSDRTSAENTQVEPSEIENQAQRDAELLNARMAGIDTPDDMNGLDALRGTRTVAATQNSIFSSIAANNVVVEKTARVTTDSHSTQALNASRNSIYASQADDAGRVTAAIPLPDADRVGEIQDLALAGMDIASDETPSAAMETAAADDKSPQPVTRSLGQIDVAEATATTEEVVEPKKRRLTLADFFRKKIEENEFDGDRFGNKTKIVKASKVVPNMQTASLSDEMLPGVTANAMMPVANPAGDETDDDDSQPVGLMKLASLSGMARVAPNGLWMQTDKVDISCLRPRLVSMLKQVENHYGRPVVVTSGFRDGRHNRRAGGARHSLHTICAAADIQVQGVSKWTLAEYLRSIPGRGGVGTYCHTQSVHIDVGGERDWNWRCRRKKRRG